MTLSVTNVVRRYAGNPEPTLRGVTFDLPAGTLTALLGRSGAGKSTLLRCVMGLEPFESGTIDIDGVQVKGTTEMSSRQRAEAIREARRRLGLVFQHFELFPHLTALENCVLAPVQVKGLPREKAAAYATEVLVQLGLEQRLHAYPAHLSGGQQQRVAIARTLAMEPRVLLYDEPTSALDPTFKHEVLQVLRRVDATGVTQVVVTHDLQLAKEVEHVCVLHQGHVIESGAPQTVFSSPKQLETRRLLKSWLAEDGGRSETGEVPAKG